MGSKKLVIEAKSVVTPFEELRDIIVEVEGRYISQVVPAQSFHSQGGSRIAADIVAPGFIDLQVNGAGGVDASQVAELGLDTVSTTLARFGVTGFLPTVITAPQRELVQSLNALGRALEKPLDGAAALGIHLEGPFINPVKRGAHPVNGVKIPKVEYFQKLQDAANGRIVYLTLAPELPGSLDLIKYARGVLPIVSMGHSDATYEQALEAMRAGCDFATHVFNAMRDFHHREPGLVGIILTETRMRASVIADGTHVHPAVVEMLLKVKEPTRAVLATDCISAAGMPDGEHRFGTLTVFVKNGVCHDQEGRLAGSTLTMDLAVRNCLSWTHLARTAIFRMASYNAAEALGVADRKGTVTKGADADLVLLNETMKVEKTIVAGQIVYSRN
ncbi:MAG: N-acetylglucosamine-6-phosphate deacetylase [Acidobacteria bacterium]|nr:N-acetylglucosamine-6-phosphate deacetylase [Acidobacteriota bacterium]